MKCIHCQIEKEVKADRLPPRWKRLPISNDPCCPACWSDRYFMRAVTVPIQGPMGNGNPTVRGELWEQLRTRLYESWGASTRLANWSVQQLQMLDIKRTAEMEKLPKMPKEIYLYGLFGQFVDRAAWTGAAASAQSLMRTVEACWRASRLETLWHYTSSARTFKWPTPFPVHNANWSIEKSDQGVWSCSMTLLGGRINLQIRNDRTMQYQHARLKQLLDGRAIAGEAAIYARVVQGQDGRNGMSIRGPGGRQDYRVMLKLAGWFHRPTLIESGGRTGTMNVITGNDSLLYVEQEGEDRWIYNADDLRRRVIGQAAKMKRWSDDMKLERRFPAAIRRQNLEEMQRGVTKHRNYLTTAVAEIAKMVSSLADRRKVAEVHYDNSEHGFVPSFPYFDLKLKLKQKLDELGIKLISAVGLVGDEAEIVEEELV